MRKNELVNDVVIDPNDVNSRKTEKIATFEEPVTRIQHSIDEYSRTRKCNVKPIHIQAMKVLKKAGWSVRQISIVLGFRYRTVEKHLYTVKAPRIRKSRKIPDYLKERISYSRIYRSELKEEGLI